MCVCMCVCLCVGVWVWVWVSVCGCACVHVCACVCVMYQCTNACLCVGVHFIVSQSSLPNPHFPPPSCSITATSKPLDVVLNSVLLLQLKDFFVRKDQFGLPLDWTEQVRRRLRELRARTAAELRSQIEELLDVEVKVCVCVCVCICVCVCVYWSQLSVQYSQVGPS